MAFTQPTRVRVEALTGPRALTPADLTYLGHYVVPKTLRHEMHYGRGIALRRVNGQLRFLALSFKGNTVPRPEASYALVEFLPPAAFGGTVQTVTGLWPDIWHGEGYAGRGAQTWIGTGFAPDGRFYTVSAIDYPGTDNGRPPTIYSRVLGSNGSISDLRGPYDLAGMSPRRHAGAILQVPAWFQQQHSVGPMAFSGGGYMSRMCSAASPSLGPTLYTAPDLAAQPVGSVSGIRTLLDHTAATCGTPWYPGGTQPTTHDRGKRNATVIVEYDGGKWPAPAPDGVGRWTWGDSVWAATAWVDTPTVSGYVSVLTQMEGRCWYQTSTLHNSAQSAEWQVFDPAELAAVAAGTKQVWSLTPARRALALPGFYRGGNQGSSPARAVAGAAFDPVDRRLYLYVPMCPNPAGGEARIFAFQVP